MRKRIFLRVICLLLLIGIMFSLSGCRVLKKIATYGGEYLNQILQKESEASGDS